MSQTPSDIMKLYRQQREEALDRVASGRVPYVAQSDRCGWCLGKYDDSFSRTTRCEICSQIEALRDTEGVRPACDENKCMFAIDDPDGDYDEMGIQVVTKTHVSQQFVPRDIDHSRIINEMERQGLYVMCKDESGLAQRHLELPPMVHEYVISSIVDKVCKKAELDTYDKMYTAAICCNRGYSLHMPFVSLAEFMVNREFTEDQAVGTVMALLITLKHLAKVGFTMGAVNHDSIVFDGFNSVSRYGDVEVRLPFAPKLSSFGRASATWKGTRVFSSRADLGGVVTKDRYEIFGTFQNGWFVSHSPETLRTIQRFKSLGVEIYFGLDFYYLVTLLCIYPRFRNAFVQSRHWNAMWMRSEDSDLVQSRLLTETDPSVILQDVALSCSVIENVWAVSS